MIFKIIINLLYYRAIFPDLKIKAKKWNPKGVKTFAVCTALYDKLPECWKAIDEREKSIRDALDGSQKANAEAQSLLAQHKDLVRQIGAEREEIIKRAAKEAEEFKVDLMAKARAEGDDIVRRAKDQIARETSVALARLREEVADLAVLGASKIVASSMTPEAQKKLVSEFVDSLPRIKN